MDGVLCTPFTVNQRAEEIQPPWTNRLSLCEPLLLHPQFAPLLPSHPVRHQTAPSPLSPLSQRLRPRLPMLGRRSRFRHGDEVIFGHRAPSLRSQPDIAKVL